MFLTEIQFDTFKGKGVKLGDEGKYVLSWFDFFKKKKTKLIEWLQHQARGLVCKSTNLLSPPLPQGGLRAEESSGNLAILKKPQ